MEERLGGRPYQSIFGDFIRQFIFICRTLRKMPGQHAPNLLNRFDQRVTELLGLKMRAHSFYNALPELFAAFLMNRLIANNGELIYTRRHEDQHRVALARLVHIEPMKLLLRRKKGITLQLAALDHNANLTGSFRFRFANRFDDLVVLKLTEEFPRSHLSPARSRAASSETSAATTEPAKAAAVATAATGRPAAAARDKHRTATSR